MKVFGVDIDGVLTNGHITKRDNPMALQGATVRSDAVKHMQEWVMDGWVPSIVTDFPVSTEHMLVAEMWLSSHKIPYSNLLMCVTSYTDAIKWLNCSFFVTRDPEKFSVALAFNKELRLYVIRHAANKDFEKFLPTDVNNKTRDRIYFVDGFANITEIEKNAPMH